MPIPADVCRARIQFQLGTPPGGDIAVLGFHLHRLHQTGNTTDWPSDVQEISDKIADKWVAHMTNLAQFTTDVSATVVEVYHLDAATGHTLDKGSTGMTGARAWKGTATTACLPFSVGWAVSLYAYAPGSFTPNKRSKMGRFYLPPMAAGVMDSGTAAGQMNAGNANVASAAVTAFLDDVNGLEVGSALNGALSADVMELGVLSKTRGEFHQTTHVRFGHRPDVQRRRENKLPETYVDTTIAAA